MERTTLGKVFDSSPSDVPVLAKLLQLACDTLPDGWREWSLASNSSAFATVDEKTRQRIRFALPTVDIIRAFAPTASSASLVECSEFCAQMLQLPFCRGLVLIPKSLAVPIHGSQEQLSVVLRATEKMQPFFLSWADAASLLEEDRDSFSMPDLTDSRADGGSTESRLLNIERALEKLLQ